MERVSHNPNYPAFHSHVLIRFSEASYYNAKVGETNVKDVAW